MTTKTFPKHRLHALVVSVLAAVCAVLAPLPSPAHAGPRDPVQEYLGTVAEDVDAPGMAVAVVRRDGDPSIWTLGRAGNDTPITRRSPFLLGSVSKSMTAATVMDLVAEDRLALDDSLGEVLPDHGIADTRADDITVEQLLTHTGGLTTADGLAHADRFDNAPGALQRQATGLDDVDLVRDPGSGYEYSDLGYLLLGAVVERVGDEPFGQQVRDRVLRPAGVERSVTDEVSSASLPPGHRSAFGHPIAFDSRYDTSGAPYGYLGTDLDGAMSWAKAQLGGGGLDEDVLAQMHTGQVDTGSGDRYGYGWRVDEVDGERVIHHTGATPGYFSHVYLLPQRGEAVVVLANSYNEAAAPALAQIAPDVARLGHGKPAHGAASDPMLSAAPFVVAGVAALGLLMAYLLPRRRRSAIALVVLSVGVVALALMAPALLGYSSAQLRLWAPDLGFGLLVAAATWALAGVVGVVSATRRGRRPPATA